MARSITSHYLPHRTRLHRTIIMAVGQGELLVCPTPRTRIANSAGFGA